jgi:hypothetical protein
MRKFWSIICVSALFLAVVLCSCASSFDKNDKVISEIRVNRYEGSVASNFAYAVTGEREKDYKVDGKSGERVDFFILTVEGVFSSAPKCEFTLNGKEYKGEMKKHPFGESYSFEVCEKITEKQVAVSVEIDGERHSATLVSVLAENAKTHSFAFSVAQKELSSAINPHLKNGVFDGEVYIRIVPNPVSDDGKYFWYVAFYKSADECFSVLIDIESGEVIASKKPR